jgi:hypothetical protein
MKPGDFFLGIIDFFSTLVPGAIATYLLTSSVIFQNFQHSPSIPRNSAEAWTIFLVFSYVVGHLIAAIGSIFLDPVYDRIYAKWKRTTVKYVKSMLTPDQKYSLWRRIEFVFKEINSKGRIKPPEDELLKVAKILKKQQLEKIAYSAQVPPLNISNTYWWAGTIVRTNIPAGAMEVDALAAQSKLFRSLTLLIPLVFIWLNRFDFKTTFIAIIILILCFHRFLRLRWDATERTYEYFIVSMLQNNNKNQ